MATYVLVHGAWHGGWCWSKLVPLLEATRHRAIALDLPGHGNDKTPLAELSLDRYVACVSTAIGTIDEPVVLVGHSLGGTVISQTAEMHPDRILKLIYLCAFYS